MSSTHRKKLARRLAEVADISYQKALAVVVEAAEAGLLPSTLDAAGIEAAVRILTAADVPDVTKLDGTGLLRLVIEEALLAGATDIHFTTQPDTFDVYMRCDGTLSQLGSYPVEAGQLLLSKIKLDAGMRVDNMNDPESGALRYQLSEDQTVSLRVETFSSQGGPAAVMRIVGPYAALAFYGAGWSGLGFTAADQARLSELTNRPNGLVLVTGPVGCGKTVTTYEFVRQHADAGRRVITLEDPIEHLFENPLVEQVQPDRTSTLTRAAQARVLMRRDPDTFLYGEIRDIADAQAVVGIANTGTFCVATLHAAGPAHTIARMMHTLPDGHEDEFATTLTAVISQCLVPVDGRRQLRAEVLIVTDEIRDLIRAKVTDVATLEAAMERAGVVVTEDGPSGRPRTSKPSVLPSLPKGLTLNLGPTGSGKSRALADLLVGAKALDALGIEARDDGGRHTLLVGPTGSGKSVVARAMVAAALGEGRRVLVVDSLKQGTDYTVFGDAVEVVSEDEAIDDLFAGLVSGKATLTPTLLVVEELRTQSARLDALASTLIRTSGDVRVVVTAQSVKAGELAGISLFSAKVLFGGASFGQRVAVFGAPAQDTMSTTLAQGWAHVWTPGELRVVNVWGREEDDPAKVAAQAASHESRVIIERTFAPVADLVDLGSSVPDALEVMAAEYADRTDLNVGPVLTALVKAMRGDRSMTSAMSESGVFSPWAIRAIELGERSGRVSEALRTVARRAV